MNLVQDVIQEYFDHFLIVFMDDVLILYGSTEKYWKNLRLIYQRPKGQQIDVKAPKFHIYMQELDFLGQWVTTRDAALVRAESKAVHKW